LEGRTTIQPKGGGVETSPGLKVLGGREGEEKITCGEEKGPIYPSRKLEGEKSRGVSNLKGSIEGEQGRPGPNVVHWGGAPGSFWKRKGRLENRPRKRVKRLRRKLGHSLFPSVRETFNTNETQGKRTMLSQKDGEKERERSGKKPEQRWTGTIKKEGERE